VLLVKTDLNQIDVARVQVGQTAEVTLDALPGKKFSARVTRVAAAAASVGGRDLFPVEAALERQGVDLAAIKPGMTADVRILVERKPQVLVLPIEAVLSERGKSLVNVVQTSPGQPGRQRTEPREVKLGARNDREVELVSGLKAGEQVIIKPPSAVDPMR
jgi:macrolide-specific efflux system membrane fusion protein